MVGLGITMDAVPEDADAGAIFSKPQSMLYSGIGKDRELSWLSNPAIPKSPG